MTSKLVLLFGGRPANSLLATFMLWGLWTLSWAIAAVWSRRAQVRAPARTEVLNRIPTGIGGLLLFFGSGFWFGPHRHVWGAVRLWTLPSWVGWTMTGLCAVGFAFAWWARLTLGDLWSGTVSKKVDHEIVDHGPYAVVRHPIYTGILFAAFVLAIQIGTLASLLGAVLLAIGLWMRAKVEERFLSAELSEGAYSNYLGRTPMLMPFWPKGR